MGELTSQAGAAAAGRDIYPGRLCQRPIRRYGGRCHGPMRQPMGPVPMQRQCKDQRLTFRLLQHFLELIADYLGELAASLTALCLCTSIIQLYRVGN